MSFEYGRKLLLAQLKHLRDNQRVSDLFIDEDKVNSFFETKKVDLPLDWAPEFYEYWKEFVESPEGSTRENGVFYNDEEILYGIENKVHAFFSPIFDCLKEEFKKDVLLFDLVISPHYGSETTVVLLYGGTSKLLLYPVQTLYVDFLKTWHAYFSEENFECVLKELDILHRTVREQLLFVQEKVVPLFEK